MLLRLAVPSWLVHLVIATCDVTDRFLSRQKIAWDYSCS